MATNYEILMSLSKKQMAAFIHSLVNKEVSRYIDWNAWLLSENPEPPYRGEAAFLKEDGQETECFLLEENEENGVRTRTVFIPGEKGNVILKQMEAHFVRKASEAIYPAAPLPELDEEELKAAADESDLVLESLLNETEQEAEALDQLINESIDLGLEEKTETPQPEETAAEETAQPEEVTPAAEPEPEEPQLPETEAETDPEIEIPQVKFDEIETIEQTDDEIKAEKAVIEEDDEIPDIALSEIIAEASPLEEEPGLPENLPLTEADDEPLSFEEPEEDDLVLPPYTQMTPAEERTRQLEIQALLFDDDDEDEQPMQEKPEPVITKAEAEPVTEEPELVKEEPQPAVVEPEPETAEEEDDLFDFDLSLLDELDSAVLAAEQKETEATSSLNFKDLQTAETPVKEPEEPVSEEEQPEEDEVVDFFDEQDRAAASEPDYYSRGRIELLKESLFDDYDEPPLGTGDLVFQETTAIEIDRNEQKIPEAADLDEGIAFADVEIPEKMIETAKKAESTSSMELQEDEDADSFFDRFRELTESEPEDDATAELDLEELKKESSVLGRLADRNEQNEPEKTPEEEERDFRSDTLAMLLIDKKKTSMLYDPNDPEDQELPTIAFSAIDNEEEQMF